MWQAEQHWCLFVNKPCWKSFFNVRLVFWFDIWFVANLENYVGMETSWCLIHRTQNSYFSSSSHATIVDAYLHYENWIIFFNEKNFDIKKLLQKGVCKMHSRQSRYKVGKVGSNLWSLFLHFLHHYRGKVRQSRDLFFQL